jgi:hypothetical protein
MQKYIVHVHYTITHEVELWANNEEEAKDVAIHATNNFEAQADAVGLDLQDACIVDPWPPEEEL